MFRRHPKHGTLILPCDVMSRLSRLACLSAIFPTSQKLEGAAVSLSVLTAHAVVHESTLYVSNLSNIYQTLEF